MLCATASVYTYLCHCDLRIVLVFKFLVIYICFLDHYLSSYLDLIVILFRFRSIVAPIFTLKCVFTPTGFEKFKFDAVKYFIRYFILLCNAEIQHCLFSCFSRIAK